MNKNYFFAVSQLDLPKAFDSISHHQLNIKLNDLRFSERASKMINGFICNIQQITVVSKIEPIASHSTKMYRKVHLCDP